MNKHLLNILLLFYFTTGFCQQNSKSNFRKLYITEEKYSIMFPSDWVIENSDSLKYHFTLIRQESNAPNDNDGTIVLRIKNLNYPKVKMKLVKSVMEKKLKFAEEILSSREIKKSGLTGQEYVYKKMVRGKLNTFVEYLFIKGTDFYTLIFGCDSTEYLQNIAIAQSIIKTLEIK